MSDTSGPWPYEGVSPAAAPHPVRLPVNVQHWDRISFLHWPFEPAQVQSLLSPGITVSTFDDAAWVGVTPFFIWVRPLGLPIVPPGWAFPETNIRTYVTGPDGRPGVHFLHMEVTASWFVATLRSLGLPYVRRDMSVAFDGERLSYRSSSHRPGGGGGHDIVVRPGRALVPSHGGPMEHFLTARWAAYHAVGPVLLRTFVEHPAWRLQTAIAEHCEVASLFDAAGLPAPDEPPVVHVSPGVTVRVGRPRLTR